MRKEKEQVGDTKKRILEVAEKLFAENGVKTTSLGDVAKAAEISKGTLYYYYSTKEEMICDITDIHLNLISKELMDEVSNISESASKEDMIINVIQRIISAETRGKLHIYLLSEAITHDSQLKSRIVKKYEEWLELILIGINITTKQEAFNTRAVAQIIIALIDGFSIQKLMGMDNLAIEAVAKILVSGYLNL